MNLGLEMEVLEDLYTEESSSEINLKKLAQLLKIRDKEIAQALKIDPSQMSRKPVAPSNEVLKQWLYIFNLIIKIIKESEPNKNAGEIKVKMQRWLKLPRPEFAGNSALDYMLDGKARRVKNILEQLAA